MKFAIASLVSISPYSQGRHYSDSVPRLEKESHENYENRTWFNRIHLTSDGHVEIPGNAFALCVKGAARRLKIQVPGKGRTEFAKYFDAGIMVAENVKLPHRIENIGKDTLFVPADGVRGGGKRVTRHFPRIDSWSADVSFYVFDDIITESVFTQVVRSAGLLVGVGRFRPENCGFYGRFKLDALKWIENADDHFSAAAQ